MAVKSVLEYSIHQERDHHGLPLATWNRKHFERIEELILFDDKN